MKLTIVKQNAEFVVVKCEFDSALDAASYPCFTGEETIISITRGREQTYTIFYQNDKSFQFTLDRTRNPSVSNPMGYLCRMMINFLASHGINLKEQTDQIQNTIRQVYFPHDECIQKHLIYLGSQFLCPYYHKNFLKLFPNLKFQKRGTSVTGAIIEYYTFDPIPLEKPLELNPNPFRTFK